MPLKNLESGPLESPSMAGYHVVVCRLGLGLGLWLVWEPMDNDVRVMTVQNLTGVYICIVKKCQLDAGLPPVK